MTQLHFTDIDLVLFTLDFCIGFVCIVVLYYWSVTATLHAVVLVRSNGTDELTSTCWGW